MAMTITDRDSKLPIRIGSTVKGMYGDEWIFLAYVQETDSVWVRDPITLKVIDLMPNMIGIDIHPA
jgi:hypothetical protein